jgi:hypothetical protein
LPKTPLNIYQLATPAANKRTLLDIAGRFDLGANARAGKFQEDEARLTYAEGPHVIRLYRASGGLRYQDQRRWQKDDGQANSVLSDSEAVKIARGYVARHDLAPLSECKVRKVTRLRVATVERASRRAEERVIDVGVNFQRSVDGTVVDGPGGNVTVYIDHAGEVTGCDKIWRPAQGVYRPIDDLRPPGFAEEQFARYARYYGPSRIEVREFRFAYFELGWKARQRYLQPAYILLFTVSSEDQRFRRNSVYVVAAATNGVGTLTPAPQRVEPQVPRGGRFSQGE